ncbi:MAG: hypothetical protein EBZ36_12715 [Acidobacteria bacterium]|nr:hypothetical protein [Acidobacteriota bacterium]
MACTPIPTPASLEEAVALLGAYHRQWDAEKRHLELRIQSLEKQLFGSRSEKLPLEDNQLALIGTVFDYARIRTVANGSTGMLRETFRSIRFTFRHLPSVTLLQLVVGVVGIGLFGALVWLRAAIPQSSGGRVFAAFLVGQLAIGVRLWHRVWLTAAQIELHRRITQRDDAPEEIYAEEYSEPSSEYTQ